MAKIENIMMYKLKRGDITNTDQLAEAVAMLSVFGTMERITQEINAVIAFMNESGQFKTREESERHARQAAALIGNDRLYMLRDLLYIHTRNMESIEELLSTVVKEPGEEQRKKILKSGDQIANEYYAAGWQPIIREYINAAADYMAPEGPETPGRQEDGQITE